MDVPSNTNKNVSNKFQTVIAFAAVYLIWGSTYLAIRFTIETLPPFLSAGLRFLVAGLLLYAFARLKNGQPAPSRAQWKSSCIIGGLMLLGGNGCVVTAERYVPSGLAALFIAITPLWMVLLEWWWHQTKRPSFGVFVGILVGFLGVWLLMAPNLLHQGTHHIHVGGALLLLMASFSWSIGSVYSRRAPLPQSPFLSSAMQMISGSMLLILVGLINGELAHCHLSDFSVKSMGALIYLIFIGSLLGYTAFTWLIKNVGVARTSTYAFVNPVVAIFLGCSLAGEKLDAQTAIAAFFVLVAVIVITVYHKEPKKDAIRDFK